jgi:hypothetical protein
VAAGTLRGGSAGARDGRCAITPPYLAAAPLILALLTIRMTRSLYNHHVTPKGRIRWLTRALRNGRFRRYLAIDAPRGEGFKFRPKRTSGMGSKRQNWTTSGYISSA